MRSRRPAVAYIRRRPSGRPIDPKTAILASGLRRVRPQRITTAISSLAYGTQTVSSRSLLHDLPDDPCDHVEAHAGRSRCARGVESTMATPAAAPGSHEP